MVVDKPSFYAILPADVRYAEDLTSLQKILYAEITALTNKEWYCYAGNSYFAELYNKDPTRVSKTISDMQKKWYLQVSRENESWFVRRIYVWELKELKKTIKTTCRKVQKASCRKTQDPSCTWVQGGIEEKCKTPLAENCNIIIQDNNTTSNNTLSSNEESILTDTKQEKKSDLKISSSLKNSGEEKEKSSAKKEKEVYGDPDINECLDLVKSYNGGIVNGSDAKQRQFANHLIKKLQKLTSVQEGRFTWQATLEMILKIISENEYHAVKIASPELIYRNLASLMQICKAEFQKIKPQRVVKKL